jgi:DNA-binding helix-hairpin-helix protein with protein kinase domain
MLLRLERNGKLITLRTPPIALGGEAYLYAVEEDESIIAKVYHKPTPERGDKLAAMIANPPIDPMTGSGHVSIAWPIDRLFSYDDEPRCVGFIMPRIPHTHSIFEYYNPKTRRQLCPLFHYRYLIRTARNLASAFNALHSVGYVVGDVNESNILVSESALITLVDTDSFQVPLGATTFRCPVGKPEFTPPELHDVHFRDIDRLAEHDAFGLAVMIFLLLMEGIHPFAGRPTDGSEPLPLGDRIAEHLYPYAIGRQVPYEPMPTAPPVGLLHPDVRALMRQCFELGHSNPALRPRAATWQQVLDAAEGNLRLCRANTQHFYRFGLSSCPWCERKQMMNGRDPFPSRKAVQNGEHLKPAITRTMQTIVIDPYAAGNPPPAVASAGSTRGE